MKLIALDNGHGIRTPGKRTPRWTDGTKSIYTKKNYMHEWEFNRGVVKRLKPLLEKKGFKVLEVSPTEVDVPLFHRTKLANDQKADMFISVHANAIGNVWNNRVEGIETLTNLKRQGHVKLAKILQKHMVKATSLRDRGLKDGSWLGVVRGATMVSALVECGFMDNPKEAKLLNTSEYRQTIAEALCDAICEFYGVK